ncbi:zinc finger, CCHC-type containing protein [Tanacetum coccineum]
MKSGVVKHLGVPVIQQQNGLVKETNMTLLAKVRCFLIQSGLSKVFWAEYTTMSTYLMNRSPLSAIGFKTPEDMLDDVTSKVVLNRNMSFNESGEYNKTFIGYGVDTGSAQVLQGVEFEVEPQEAHTFEVEPHVNFDHVAVAAVEKIYAHESLTLNNTVACEVIFKWKAGLKDDMDAQSDMYLWIDYAMGRSTTVMGRSITSGKHDTYEGCKGGYLAKETRNRVRIRAKDSSGYCYRCLVKGYPRFKVLALVEAAVYRRFLI